MKSVLIADDSKIAGKIAAGALQRILGKGTHCTYASCSKEALETLWEVKQDVILLDLTMAPGQGGVEFLSELRNKAEYEKFRNIPVIICSAETEDDPKVALAFELGASGRISKPFTDEQLTKELKKAGVM